MKLLVTTSELINEERIFRFEYMKESFESIARIQTDYTKIIVSINMIDDDLLEKFASQFRHIPVDIEYRQTDVSKLYNPYLLCWEHKNYMQEFLDSDFTHFIYYENDIRITQYNIDYWLETRELFLRNGLNFIPGMSRIEVDNRGFVYSLDILVRENRPIVTVEDRKFVSLVSPYHAMFIMDRALVQEHLSSPFFTFDPDRTFWGVSEQANVGNYYDNVPEGLTHRSLIPIDQFDKCWVHHLPNKFVNLPNDTFGKLPIMQVIPNLEL